MTEPALQIPVADEVDVLVVGGGMTGVAAALSAARLGLRTLIIEQFNCLGGTATSGAHNHISQFTSWSSPERIVGGIPYELAQRLLRENYATWDGSCVDFNVEGMKLTLDRMAAEAGVAVLYYTFFCDSLVQDGRVTGAIVQNKSGRQAILASRIIDCTGDADVAALAGVHFHKGRESDGLCQPTTLMFTIAGVDWPRVAAWRKDFFMTEVWLKAQAEGIMAPFQDRIMGFWHTDVLPDQVGVNMTHIIRADSTDARQLTRATIEGRRQAHHLVEVFRKVVPGMETCYLISTAPSLGVRESRRIEGEVVLTEEDIMARRQWEDAICYGSFYIDIHNPAGPGMSSQTYWPEPGFHYQIPYRVMLPKVVDNLLVAGRCISTTHVALGSIRVMITCMTLGEAGGAAAALSILKQTSPRALPVGLLREQLKKQGAIVDEEGIARANRALA